MINKLRNVLLPFCLACLIAYLLEPLVELHLSVGFGSRDVSLP